VLAEILAGGKASIDAYLALAEAHVADNRVADARAVLEAGTSAHPDSPALRNRLAQLPAAP
jgi:hypothetical protein